MKSIDVFWHWFQNHENQVYDQYEDRIIGDQIDGFLEKIHPRLGWEIGPADNDRLYFAISPELDESLVCVAQKILSLSYQSQYWEFRLGRQRKPWSNIMLFANSEYADQGLQTLDLSEWKHIAFRVKDSELIDIVFDCGNNFKLEKGDLEDVGILVAIGVIGEMTVMEKVNSIEVVRRFDEKDERTAKPAAWLSYVFGMNPLLER